MSLSSLPSDILFEIFTYFDDLGDLRATVTANRSLYCAFKDHRTKLLKHVFRSQILRYHDHCCKRGERGVPTKNTPTRLLNYVNNLAKGKNTNLSKPDELTLRVVAWSTFLEFRSPFWVFGSFGRQLVSVCEELEQTELALSYAEEVWGYLRIRYTSEYLTRKNIIVIERNTNNFALTLADMYFNDFNRPQDAFRVIQERYDMNTKDYDFKLLFRLIEYSKEATEQEAILSFLQSRAAVELQGLHLSRTVHGDLHSTFCLTFVLCKLEKFQDAICIFNNTFNTFVELDLDPVSLTGLARRLIASLTEVQLYDEALTIRRQVLYLFSRTNRSTTSQYFGWAKQYIWELYSFGRPDDALIVEEQCWNHARVRMASSRQRSYVYTGRNAAWSLYRSYEKRGEHERAQIIRWEYESLARPCMQLGEYVPWPGENGCARMTKTCDDTGWASLPSQVSHMTAVKV